MGNAQKDNGPTIKQVTPSEIKSFIMIAQNRLSLSRNKRLDSMRKKKGQTTIGRPFHKIESSKKEQL